LTEWFVMRKAHHFHCIIHLWGSYVSLQNASNPLLNQFTYSL